MLKNLRITGYDLSERFRRRASAGQRVEARGTGMYGRVSRIISTNCATEIQTEAAETGPYCFNRRFMYSALSAMLRIGSCVKFPPCSTK